MTNIEFNDDSTKHERRVTRLASHKCRTLVMLDYLGSRKHALSGKQLRRYRFCHNYLLFRHYLDLEKTTLHEAKHCDMHLLCPMCAIRRAAKTVMCYESKTAELVVRNPRLSLYYVVLTIRNDKNLDRSFAHLEQSVRLLIARRREALSYAKTGRKRFAYAANSVFAGVSAGAYSFEIKRGENSGLWHPHVNLLLLADKPISQSMISAEWLQITQDSYITHCERKLRAKDAFVEIFKYALKFSDMALADTYHTWKTLRGRRLTGSFGDFRGLDISKTDSEPDEAALQDFIELFYRFDGCKYGLEKRNPS